MGRWEIPVRVVAQGGFATTLAGSVFHCRAANALRHAHIAVIKHILERKEEKKKNLRQSKLTSVCHSPACRAMKRPMLCKPISSVIPALLNVLKDYSL